MIFQKTPAKCGCSMCDTGCLCGDCSGCSNALSDRMFLRNVKRASILCVLLLAIGGFMFFAPVVPVVSSLGSIAPVTTGVPSFRIQTTETSSTAELCSITYCYLGQGAIYTNGTYYPVTKPLQSGVLQRQGSRGDVDWSGFAIPSPR
ncbi:MAG: hypothetical protein ABSF83_12345 [Nitrososphaerales archaeon]